MPIYEYECGKCGVKLEVIQKMSDPPLVRHKDCGGKLSKLISASGIQFKGSGWYVTDYARKGSSSKSSDGGESNPKSEGPSTTTSESKPSESKPPSSTPSE